MAENRNPYGAVRGVFGYGLSTENCQRVLVHQHDRSCKLIHEFAAEHGIVYRRIQSPPSTPETNSVAHET